MKVKAIVHALLWRHKKNSPSKEALCGQTVFYDNGVIAFIYGYPPYEKNPCKEILLTVQENN